VTSTVGAGAGCEKSERIARVVGQWASEVCYRDPPPRPLLPARPSSPPAIAPPAGQSALSRLSKGGDPGLLVRSATVGSLARSSAIALLRGILPGMLLGLVMADHAAGSSP